ncbi:MAG: amidohydrolase family protein [Candidatus Binataceae bacterium]
MVNSSSGTKSRSFAIRATLRHPVIDCDGHMTEFEPAFLDYLREAAGSDVAERYKSAPDSGFRFPWYSMTDAQRRDNRSFRTPWWFHLARRTIDRASSSIPALLYERMPELGLDFAILYPSLGFFAIHMWDEELRRAACRAFNSFYAGTFREFASRITPVALIPMHTPAEALDELDHVVRELGLKAIMMPAFARRPIPALAKKAPELARNLCWFDNFCLDSEHDYDPVWARCVELGVAPTFHSPSMGIGTRGSISNITYNHLGHFAYSGESICKALFLGGVTRRFPRLRFAFQEGGAGWGCILYRDLIAHWETRNPAALENVNPANLDHRRLREFFVQYGGKMVSGNRLDRADERSNLFWGAAEGEGEINDFAKCGIERAEDIRELFVPRFFFGCEGGDRLTAWAFDSRRNPFGARLSAIFGSDIGHFDLPDMTEAVAEASHLVEQRLIGEGDLRDFLFANPVRLHAAMNPGFFKGTAIESEAAAVLAESPRD